MHTLVQRTLLVTALVASPLVVTACGHKPAQPVHVPANAVKVHVTASNWKWTLDKTSFKVGVPIDFIVKSDEGTHGFSITNTKVSQAVTKGDKPTDVVWTPEKPGTYVIRCDIYCGAGHQNMWTKINVQS